MALFVALIVAAVDSLSKRAIRDTLGPSSDRDSVELLGNTVSFRFVENEGIAFGLLSGGGWLVWGLVVLASMAMLWTIVRFASDMTVPMAIACGLIVGGAAGNLIDRQGDGKVTDFVAVWSWPVFNVADASITIGGIVLLLLVFHASERSAESQPGLD